jgi:hypothetical protein
MKNLMTVLIFAFGLISMLGTASAFPADPSSEPVPLWQTVASFQGAIPSASNPIRDAKRLARMRREGKLPDSFVRGGCRYNLAGDPGAAYYVKTCR